MTVSIFLPCRAGSERVYKKNTKSFANNGDSLLDIKLNQLSKCTMIDKIYLSTNDELIIDEVNTDDGKIIIDHREPSLCSSDTPLSSLIEYVPSIINEEHILWTHVTAPFITASIYDKAIEQYFKVLEDGYDSLMSVLKHQNFMWYDSRPINFDKKQNKWPRTQDLQPVLELTNGIFISSRSNYLLYGDRIGKNVNMYQLNKYSSIDIDDNSDFEFASRLYDSVYEY